MAGLRNAMLQRLFVYGSLCPGGPNHHLLFEIGGSRAAASVRGRLQDRGWGSKLGYPGLVLDERAEPVPGDVFESEKLEENWERLDELEGEEYRRVTTRVELGNGTSVEAFVYVLR